MLAHPAVSATIPGAKRPKQVEDNVEAARRPLTEQELARIRQALEALPTTAEG